MTNEIRIGLFGAFDFLGRVMSDAFINHHNFNIVGLASNSSQRLEFISDKFKCRKYNSYHELININLMYAAYISLPNSMHYEIC